MTDFSSGAGWVGGEFVPIGEAKIGVTDWGVTHSDITYDVVPVWNGRFFRLDDYLDRFERSMARLRLSVPEDRATLRAALHKMVALTGIQDAYCAMVASRGSPLIPGTRDPRKCGNHLFGWTVPFVNVIPLDVQARGAKVRLAETVERIPDTAVDHTIKNYHWGDFTAGLFEAYDNGADTTLLADRDGNITEGPGFNAFIIKGNNVATPDRHCLKGITRRTTLELAEEHGMSVAERTIPKEEMFEADEVFLTTSGGGVIPVARVNGRVFSNDAPGPVTMQLREAYFARRKDPAYTEAVNYGAVH